MAERRQPIMWLLSAALVTLLVLLFAPSGASAQTDDGVTVDPNSPSGTEYDIPTERARRDAGGSKKKSEKKSDSKAPLFGQGVGKEPTATPTATVTPTATPTSTVSATAAKKAKARAAARKKAREAKERRRREAAAAATATPTPSPPPSADVERVSDTVSGGGSSWALIGGMAVGLVIVGTAGGLVLRRRFSS
jgi:hypothetical protein